MKLIYLFLFIGSLAWGQNEKRQQAYQLQGNVKSLKITQSKLPKAAEALLFDPLDDDQFLLFDKKGRITELDTYFRGRQPRTIQKWTYDDKNHVSKEVLELVPEKLTQTTSYTCFGQVLTRTSPYFLTGEVKSVRTTIDYREISYY